MNKADNELVKSDLKAVQEKAISTIQAISKVMMAEVFTPRYLENKMNDIVECSEATCVAARNVYEKYIRIYPAEEKLKRTQKTVTQAAGDIEITVEGWVHIRLNSLLPHCKYKNNTYLFDTLKRLLEEFEKPLPRFDKAFMAIVEYCDYDSRRVYDQDNKGWKMIANAIKGRLIEDDNQFQLSIGLFSKNSPELACQIYVLPEQDLSDFMFYLSTNLL